MRSRGSSLRFIISVFGLFALLRATLSSGQPINLDVAIPRIPEFEPAGGIIPDVQPEKLFPEIGQVDLHAKDESPSAPHTPTVLSKLPVAFIGTEGERLPPIDVVSYFHSDIPSEVRYRIDAGKLPCCLDLNTKTGRIEGNIEVGIKNRGNHWALIRAGIPGKTWSDPLMVRVNVYPSMTLVDSITRGSRPVPFIKDPEVIWGLPEQYLLHSLTFRHHPDDKIVGYRVEGDLPPNFEVEANAVHGQFLSGDKHDYRFKVFARNAHGESEPYEVSIPIAHWPDTQKRDPAGAPRVPIVFIQGKENTEVEIHSINYYFGYEFDHLKIGNGMLPKGLHIQAKDYRWIVTGRIAYAGGGTDPSIPKEYHAPVRTCDPDDVCNPYGINLIFSVTFDPPIPEHQVINAKAGEMLPVRALFKAGSWPIHLYRSIGEHSNIPQPLFDFDASTGVLSRLPEHSGKYVFRFQAGDSQWDIRWSEPASVTINISGPEVIKHELSVTEQFPFELDLHSLFKVPQDLRVTLKSGVIPRGLTLNTVNGKFSGTPKLQPDRQKYEATFKHGRNGPHMFDTYGMVFECQNAAGNFENHQLNFTIKRFPTPPIPLKGDHVLKAEKGEKFEFELSKFFNPRGFAITTYAFHYTFDGGFLSEDEDFTLDKKTGKLSGKSAAVLTMNLLVQASNEFGSSSFIGVDVEITPAVTHKPSPQLAEPPPVETPRQDAELNERFDAAEEQDAENETTPESADDYSYVKTGLSLFATAATIAGGFFCHRRREQQQPLVIVQAPEDEPENQNAGPVALL